MNGHTLNISGVSQSVHYNHFIQLEPDVAGALRAVIARLRELDPSGIDHWLTDHLQQFGVSSSYLSSISSLDVFPFDISTSFGTINPTCLTRFTDPIAQPCFFTAANTADETGRGDEPTPLSDPGDKTTFNERVAYFDGAKCHGLAAEWDIITNNSNSISISGVEHDQQNQVDLLVETDKKVVGGDDDEDGETKKCLKSFADCEEDGSGNKDSEEEKESYASHKSPAIGDFTVGREASMKFIKDEEESSEAESEDGVSADDGDYKDDEDPDFDDEFEYGFEQSISRPLTPPSSPPVPISVSGQKSRLPYRCSYGGKSFGKTAGKTTFSRTPLPSSPITKTNNKNVSPSKKRARTDGGDEKRLPSPKVARKGKAASPTGTRARRPAWSDLEQNALHQLLVERRAQEAQWPTLEKKFDNGLWSLMSEQLMARFNIDRAPMACKNHWARKGRYMSGFDERSALKRSNKLATSVQVRKTEM